MGYRERGDLSRRDARPVRRNYDDLSGLYIVDAEGGRPVPLPIPRGRVSAPTFSPDGTQIAYLVRGHAGPRCGWRTRTAPTRTRSWRTTRPCGRGGTASQWSPAGDRIAIQALHREWQRRDLHLRPRRLGPHTGGHRCGSRPTGRPTGHRSRTTSGAMTIDSSPSHRRGDAGPARGRRPGDRRCGRLQRPGVRLRGLRPMASGRRRPGGRAHADPRESFERANVEVLSFTGSVVPPRRTRRSRRREPRDRRGTRARRGPRQVLSPPMVGGRPLGGVRDASRAGRRSGAVGRERVAGASSGRHGRNPHLGDGPRLGPLAVDPTGVDAPRPLVLLERLEHDRPRDRRVDRLGTIPDDVDDSPRPRGHRTGRGSCSAARDGALYSVDVRSGGLSLLVRLPVEDSIRSTEIDVVTGRRAHRRHDLQGSAGSPLRDGRRRIERPPLAR